MSYEQIKEFVKSSVKEGSLSIITFMISSLTVLFYYPSPLILKIFQIVWIIGFLTTWAVILWRIALSQYIIARLRIDKLKIDLNTNDYSDLKNDKLNALIPLITEQMTSRIIAMVKKSEQDGESKENEL